MQSGPGRGVWEVDEESHSLPRRTVVLRGWRLAPGTVAGGVTDGNRKEASEVVLGTGRDHQEGKEPLSPVTGVQFPELLWRWG